MLIIQSLTSLLVRPPLPHLCSRRVWKTEEQVRTMMDFKKHTVNSWSRSLYGIFNELYFKPSNFVEALYVPGVDSYIFNYDYLKKEWNSPFIDCKNVFFLMVSQSAINFASNKVVSKVIVLISKELQCRAWDEGYLMLDILSTLISKFKCVLREFHFGSIQRTFGFR